MDEQAEIIYHRDTILAGLQHGQAVQPPPPHPHTPYEKGWYLAYHAQPNHRRRGGFVEILIGGGLVVGANVNSYNNGGILNSTDLIWILFGTGLLIVGIVRSVRVASSRTPIVLFGFGALAAIIAYLTYVHFVPPAMPTTATRVSAPPIVSRPLPTVTVPTVAPLPITPAIQYTPLPGSWVAYAPTISIRLYALPQWDDKPEFSDLRHLSLGTDSDSLDFEAYDVYRFPGVSGSATVNAWDAEYMGYVSSPKLYSPVVTSTPRPQKAAGYDGMIGQFHYTQTTNDLQIDVTMWIGQVGGDRVAMIFRCDPSRDISLDLAVAQVLATIDFNAS